MPINHNNIEEFLLDYMDGNLNPILTAELMAFLAENPEYEALVSGEQVHAPVTSGDRNFFGNLLKKDFKDILEINQQNFDEFCIAASEGLLGPPELQKLNLYIGEDSRKIKNLELFNNLKLKADLSVRYPGKDKIRKNKALVLPMRILYYTVAVAASVAVFFMITHIRPSGKQLQVAEPPIAQKAEIKPGPKVILQKTEHSPDIKPVPSLVDSETKLSSDNIENRSVNQNPSSEDAGEIQLSELKPISRRIPQDFILNELAFVTPDNQNNPPIVKPERQMPNDSENLFAVLFSKINFWKTAETALNGFNYLTEARISIDKTTDDQGKITGLSVNTESYSIAGKIR